MRLGNGYIEERIYETEGREFDPQLRQVPNLVTQRREQIRPVTRGAVPLTDRGGAVE